MTIIKDRRMGIVRIPVDFINGSAADVRLAMAQLIVLSATFHFHEEHVEYVALCEDFEVVRPGNVLPMYSAQFHKGADGEVRLIGWIAGHA